MIGEIAKFVFVSLLIIFVPVLGHVNLHDIIDDKKFKRIKIKKFKRLFTAIGFQNVATHGIIIPLFVEQLISYFIFIITVSIGTIFIINQKSPVGLSVLVLGTEVFADLIIIAVLSIISRKRQQF